MKPWSRKANPRRDEKIYLVGLEARAAWKSLPPGSKLPGQSSFDYTKDVLEKEHGIRFNDTAGVTKAFYRGQRVHRSKDFTTRKTGRPAAPDMVQIYIIGNIVNHALVRGCSLSEAYRVARQSDEAWIYKKGRLCRPSVGAIKAIYQKARELNEDIADGYAMDAPRSPGEGRARARAFNSSKLKT